MIGRLLPKDISFLGYFEQHVELTNQACQELLALTHDSSDIAYRTSRIKELEHKADDVTHQCIDAIHRTFITPIDRTDIHRLIKRLDDIMDSVDAAAARISMYEIQEIRSEAKGLAEVLVHATEEIHEALKNLHNMKNADAVSARCIEIYSLENQGDSIQQKAIVRLFKEEKDPILVMKWKEVFETLERAVDRCEDVANIIQGIIIEAS